MESSGARPGACGSFVALAYGSDTVEDDTDTTPFEMATSDATTWNERFQRLLSNGKATATEDMATLAREFAGAAERLCLTIVEEMFASGERTVQPRNIGGLAGGPKFVDGGIFVKLSCDWKGIYGGDSWAIKSASQELLALETYLDLRIRNLHFPLVALVMYRGHALLCQSILPITSQTLQYGSQNAGQTILNESPALQSRLQLACQMLRLAPHNVAARNKSHARLLYSAADMEGHLGADGRFYLLDCSRAFPPTAPRVGDHPSRYLSLHMRPEAVKKWSGGPPLSPDAFSNFRSGSNEETRQHNQNVIEATKWLEQQLVPEFAAYLDAKVSPAAGGGGGGGLEGSVGSTSGEMEFETSSGEDEAAALVSDMHVRGINVRYLGLVLSHLKQASNQALVLCEMAARCVKHKVFELWRKIARNNAEDFVAVATSWLHGLEHKDALWKEHIMPRMAEYFIGTPKEYVERASQLRGLLAPRMSQLVARTAFLIGFANGAVIPRVKHLSREPDAAKQKALLLQAASLFRALKHDNRATYNLALVLSKIGKLCLDMSYFVNSFEVARTLIQRQSDDFRCFFLLGCAQMDASKLPLPAPEKRTLLISAKENLERAVSLSMRQNLASLSCLGHLHLQLIRFLGANQPDMGEVELLLRDAVACFEDSLEIECRSVNSMVNLAVAKTKLARVTRDAAAKDRLFEASFRNYERAASLVQQPSIFFDWANSLYRFAKEKQVRGDQRDAAAKFAKAASCYAKSLQLKRTMEAWINLGVALEKCVTMPECNQDELAPLADVYLSMQVFDLKRAELMRSKLLRSASSFKLRQACSVGGTAVASVGSSSPGEPSLKQSDEFLDAEHGLRPRRGSILTSFDASKVRTTPLVVRAAPDYATLVHNDNMGTYIAPNGEGPSFQGDTVHF